LGGRVATHGARSPTRACSTPPRPPSPTDLSDLGRTCRRHQKTRLATAIAADERYDEVHVAWLCAQQLREAYRCENLAEGRKIAEKVLDSFTTCPIPEIKRLGKTLTQWRAAFLASFDTGRSNNGGAEAINGLIELHRRVARGFRNYDNYRLRMLLVGGGLTSPHLR